MKLRGCWLVALFLLGIAVGAPQIVRSKVEVGIIGWRPNGKLLYHVADQLKEWPSGRTARLPKPPENFVGSAVHQCLQEPGKDNWLINDRIFDARTFKFGATVPREAGNNVFWANGSVGYLLTLEDDKQNETSWIVHKGKKRELDGGWSYQAISQDGRFLAALRELLSINNDLYILLLDLETGLVKPIRKYPKAVDDHLRPSGPDWNPHVRAFLVFLNTPGMGYSVIAGKSLEPIRKGHDIMSDWLSPTSSLFTSYWRWNSGQSVTYPDTRFPVLSRLHTAVVLEDARTRKRRTLIEATQTFIDRSRDTETQIRKGSTEIKDYALDFKRSRLAYVVTREEATTTGDAKFSDTRPKTDRLYVRNVNLRLR